MWGIIPAAGLGTRIQPLAFSKELLPVGSTFVGDVERPRAVSEYLVERMLRAGATKLCFVISSAKSDLMRYYGSAVTGPDGQTADVVYVVQDKPGGLCDAVFRACPLVGPGEHVLVGLPDTIWYPEDGLSALGDGGLSFLLFPVENPTVFDAVVTDGDESDPFGYVREIQVKHPDARTKWVWGAFKMQGYVLHELFRLWLGRGKRDEYVGTLVNAYLAERRPGRRRPEGDGLRRRRHPPRVPRGHRPADGPDGRDPQRGRPGRADRPTLAWNRPHGARPAANAAADVEVHPPAGRGPRPGARPVVPQPRPARRPHRPRALPRRLPGRQVEPVRPRHPGRPHAARPCWTSAATAGSTAWR